VFAAPDRLAAASSSASSVANGRGSMPLRGDQRERHAGRDRLYEILSARDGVKVRLTSPSGDRAVGLAWWSPSRGLWLAVDLANAHAGDAAGVAERRRRRAHAAGVRRNRLGRLRTRRRGLGRGRRASR
jgi:hypothetical protein